MSFSEPGPPPPGQHWPPTPEPGPPGPPSVSGPTRGQRLLALTLVLILVVAAVGYAGWMLVDSDDDGGVSADPSPRPTVTASASPAEPDLARFYGQELDWRECGRSECTSLTVPLDYAEPAGTTLKVSVLKVPAQGKRIGALVVNPGGPGGSGVDYAAAGSLQFGNVLSDHYDIVGFDPRGVGRSNPLKCLTTDGIDTLLAADPDPDDQAERDRLDRLIRGFGGGCLSKSGDLARHVSTVEAAKDMDILRAALGQEKLDYLGASYGTFLGATYADLFPERVGRFVLDGAVDPSLSNEQLSLQQAGGFETALRAYVTDCVNQGGCILGGTLDEGLARIQRLLAETDRTPLPTNDDDRPLTEGWAMLGIWMPLYVKEFWPQLTSALEQAIVDRRGTGLLGLADLYASRGPDGYDDNSMEALYAVNCLDHSDSIPTAEVPSHFAQFEKSSPTFGRAFAFSLSTCANWPVQSGNVTEALDAKGAPPIVVIGTTRDPATPYRWAVALAGQLESGRLVTRDGDGHTGFQRGNSCVDDAVEDFLVAGKAPRDGLEC